MNEYNDQHDYVLISSLMTPYPVSTAMSWYIGLSNIIV